MNIVIKQVHYLSFVVGYWSQNVLGHLKIITTKSLHITLNSSLVKDTFKIVFKFRYKNSFRKYFKYFYGKIQIQIHDMYLNTFFGFTFY